MNYTGAMSILLASRDFGTITVVQVLPPMKTSCVRRRNKKGMLD